MNCISCNESNEAPYFLQLLNNGNCIKKCKKNYLITKEGNCVLACPNGTFQFSKNFTCLKTCPKNYEKDIEINMCFIKSYKNISSSEFKTEILNNITEFLNSSSVINGSDFIAVVLKSDDMNPEEQLKKGISAIDLGNCTDQIKDYYNISKNESLIILNMESKRNDDKNIEENKNTAVDIGKNIQIEIFDISGRRLNLSVC